VDVVRYFRDRWERLAPEDLRDYPWWLPIYTMVGVTAAGAVAIGQRAGSAPVGLLVLAGALIVLDPVVNFAGKLPPWPLIMVIDAAAVALLLAYPVTTDVAPVVLILSSAKITSAKGALPGLVATGVYVAELLVAAFTAGLWGAGIWVVGTMLGFDVGFTMRWQLRALTSERARLAAERDHAAADERQRIAREVHDLVAHSLSVTMLHVTGARLALASDRDVDEAIDALTEAERVGRQTMADIRGTVAMLSAEASGTEALPGVKDIDALVETMRSAGLRVTYDARGEAVDVAPALGLGLYRITQESLSNIAKHAPSATASVQLELMPGGAHLQVRNPLPPGASRGTGAGLLGMAERAEQLGATLTAGPQGDEWCVEFTAPAEQDTAHDCLLVKLRGRP
jgi:signal transduction histidine kinase